jgi:MYXO-CTERM domain-containing protein
LPFRFTVGGGDVGDDDDSTPEPEPGEGCQCGKSDGDGEAALLALLAAPWLGRRRRRA